MKKPILVISRRAAVTSALALVATGCFGSFGATHSLYKWNSEVSDNKWLRWLVFLVLIILPVYGLFVLADVLVLNTIEFFSGKNPINDGHAELGGGHTLDSKRMSDPNLIRHEHRKDGKLVRVLYVRRVDATEFLVLDEHLRVLSRARLDANGKVILSDGAGRQLSVISPEAVERVGLALEAGASPTAAVQAALDPAQASAWAAR